MVFEHCYGYPLSGEFIRMDYCYDVPRILHCHVNPAIQRFIGGQYSREVVDAVISKKTFAYSINHTDNAQLIDLFTFGTYGGILLDGEYNIACRTGLHCAPLVHEQLGTAQIGGSVRIGIGPFNTEDHITTTIDAVGEIIDFRKKKR